MAVQEIFLLGNPTLREKCSPVRDYLSDAAQRTITDLRDTLEDFRARRGFGRGIAAPQIGSTLQITYLNFERHGAFINPKIIQRSRQKFKLWDDCFSFPDILVQVVRNYRIAVAYVDESGHRRILKVEGAMSELLQHEIDHLNGVLAIDRAIDPKHIILRSEYEKLSHRAPIRL